MTYTEDMKTIAVIGANGKSGSVFVQTALKYGYSVRAGIYKSNNLPAHENLVCIQTNATKSDEVAALLDGAEVVVSLIGHGLGNATPKDVQSTAITTILAAMHEKGLRRIVSLTGSGVRFPGDNISLLDYALNTSLRLMKPNMINDGINHAKILQASDTDWTIIRALKLTDGTAGAFQLTEHGPAKLLAPREEIALAIIQVIRDASFIHQAPIMSSLHN